MAFKIIRIEDPALLVYDMFGDVGIEDFKASRGYAVDENGQNMEINQLCIFRDEANIVCTPEELRSFSQMGNRHFDTIRLVVAPSDLNFGMSRMLVAHRDGSGDTMALLRSIEEACDVLGVPIALIENALLGECGILLKNSQAT